MSPPSSSPSTLSRLPSLSRHRSSVPPSVQPALAELLSLHSQIDSALVRLDSCPSLAALSAASLDVKHRIAQLQNRIVAVTAEVEQDEQQRPQQPPLDQTSAATEHSARFGAAGSARRFSHSGDVVDPYESVHRLLSQHSALAASYGNTLRQRLLACRAQLASRSQSVRRELFDSTSRSSSSSSPSSSLSSDSSADRQRQFTASLHHTHTMLQSSLSLSAASLSSLSSSTDSLRSTQRHSAVHAEAVKGGSKLITKQMQRQRTDRLLVWCGMAFFLLVCLYITNRRLRISRIIAFIARTLMPSLKHYTVNTVSHQQHEQHHLQWGELHAEEL